MISLLIWLSGAVVLLWQMTARGYWQDLAAVLMSGLLMVWVIFGAALISARLKFGGNNPKLQRVSPRDLQQAIDRINADRAARESVPGREPAA